MQNAQWSDLHVLMAEFRQGNTQAFQHIYHLHYRSLLVIAARLVGDTSEVEDIVAEAFIKLWQKKETFETTEHLKAWIVRVTINLAIDHLKMSKRHGISEKEILYLTEMEQDDNYLQAQLIKSKLLDKALAIIDEMPDAMRQIFKLIFIEGLKNAEIAQRLGISMDTVRVQKARALKLLKNAFHLDDLLKDPDD